MIVYINNIYIFVKILNFS